MPNKPRLLLLSRPDCHLCEEFRKELEAGFAGQYELSEACVDERADWRERYGLRIPVLIDEAGSVVCAAAFDPEQINDWFAQRR